MRKDEEITVIHKPVGKPFEVRVIPNTLEAMQAAVGGHIEVVPAQSAGITNRAAVCVVNEEGVILGLPWNWPFVGEWFICGTKGEKFASVPKHVIDVFVRKRV